MPINLSSTQLDACAGAQGKAAGESLRDRNRARARQDLYNAAEELIEEQGYEATTIADIAKRAGMAYSSFFRFFKSKEDLVMMMDQDGWDEYAVLIGLDLTEAGDPVSVLVDHLIEGYGRFDRDQRAAARKLRNRRLIMENDSLRAAYLLMDDARTRRLGHLLAEQLGLGPGEGRELMCKLRCLVAISQMALDLEAESYEEGARIRTLDTFRELLSGVGCLHGDGR